MGGVIKKIASIARPFVSMIPGVGPLIAKGMDIAMMAIERLRQARAICKGQGLSVLDEEMSKIQNSGQNKKQAAITRLENLPPQPEPPPSKARYESRFFQNDAK